jgi:3-oxoacyl-[acyl-carrier protein] reductase
MIPTFPDLEGKRFLVTGASSGIGLGVAEGLAAQGGLVTAQYRSQMDPVKDLASRFPGRIHSVGVDLATEEGCVTAVEEAFGRFGGLDGFVHSAGIWNDGPIRELSVSTLETMFRVNTFSSYFLSREAAVRMTRGSLVFIGSTAGQRGEPGHSHYAGSKGAVQSLVYSLAQELSPDIRVNLISPGWVRTPMAEEALREREERIVSAVPLRRVAEVEDIAAAALYFLSDAGCHLTGVDLSCSGGALLPLPRG